MLRHVLCGKAAKNDLFSLNKTTYHCFGHNNLVAKIKPVQTLVSGIWVDLPFCKIVSF